jgi:hypothetical protein
MIKRSYPYPIATASDSLEYLLGESGGALMQFAAIGTANFGGSIYTNLTPGESYATLDVTGQTGIVIANGASATFCPGGQGMLAIICNATSNNSALAFVGGGSVLGVGTVSAPEFVFNDTTPAAGETGLSHDGATAYKIYNNVGSSQTYKVIVLRAV